jgi:hypothetical protein
VRALLVLGLLTSTAYADVDAGASVGAGAQGASTYSAVELRLDVAWTHARLGLGVRGVWDTDGFRASDWSGPARAVTILRAFEASGALGDTTLGVAAGALAPAQIGRIADGYRVVLDDRWHTGVRTSARGDDFAAGLEIDDVLDPALVAASGAWEMARPWGMHAAVAIDPGSVAVVEVGAHHVYEGTAARAELGGSVTAELMLGAGALAYGNASIERGGVTWTARGDVRAGTGADGSLFGPLYRIEREAHDGRLGLVDRAHMGELSGVGAGLTLGASTQAGWGEVGVRERPGLGPLVVATGGAPMSRRVQAAAWAAIGRDDAAGAAEVRVAWAKQLFSAVQTARLYRFDRLNMDDQPVWMVTAWFGAMIE